MMHNWSKPPRSDLSFTFSLNISAVAFAPHIYLNLLPPPSSRGHPLMRHPSPGHQLARPGPFPVQMQKGREALSRQCKVEVPWRTKLPGWLSDEQGSVKGWGRSFPQIISPSVSQPVLRCPNTNCNQAASYTTTLFFLQFYPLWIIFFFSNRGIYNNVIVSFLIDVW